MSNGEMGTSGSDVKENRGSCCSKFADQSLLCCWSNSHPVCEPLMQMSMIPAGHCQNFCFAFFLHWRDKKCVICFSVAVSLWLIFPECVSSGSAHAHNVHVDVFRLHTTVKSGVEVLIFQDRRILQGFVWNGELGCFKLGPNLEPVWLWN